MTMADIQSACSMAVKKIINQTGFTAMADFLPAAIPLSIRLRPTHESYIALLPRVTSFHVTVTSLSFQILCQITPQRIRPRIIQKVIRYILCLSLPDTVRCLLGPGYTTSHGVITRNEYQTKAGLAFEKKTFH